MTENGSDEDKFEYVCLLAISEARRKLALLENLNVPFEIELYDGEGVPLPNGMVFSQHNPFKRRIERCRGFKLYLRATDISPEVVKIIQT